MLILEDDPVMLCMVGDYFEQHDMRAVSAMCTDRFVFTRRTVRDGAFPAVPARQRRGRSTSISGATPPTRGETPVRSVTRRPDDNGWTCSVTLSDPSGGEQPTVDRCQTATLQI